MVYGEAGSGKSTLALQLFLASLRSRLKCLYVDALGKPPSWIAERVVMAIRELGDFGFVHKAYTFRDLYELVLSLEDMIYSGLRVVIIDTLTRPYRAELGPKAISVKLNKMLNRIMALLLRDTRYCGALVLVTADVRRRLETGEEPVAAKIIDYWADVIIRLEKLEKGGIFHVEKHYDREVEGSKVRYYITKRGLEGVRAL